MAVHVDYLYYITVVVWFTLLDEQYLRSLSMQAFFSQSTYLVIV